MNDCIFCKIINKQIPSNIVKETNELLVFKDIAPKARFHYLIVPKKHIKDFGDIKPEDLSLGAKIFEMVKELSQLSPELQDFKLLVNNGALAGQKVFHFHMHFLAGLCGTVNLDSL